MRHCVQVVLANVGLLLALSVSPVLAQYPPLVDTLPSSSHGLVPSGFREICIPNPNTGAPSPTCPVLKMNGYTYWAYSDNDNMGTMAIVAYDAAGAVAGQWTKNGARYLWQIILDTNGQTVAFVGQGSAAIVVPWSEIELTPPPPQALVAVDVSAQAINCVFAASCQVTVTDTSADIPVPPGVSGTARLQTRTFPGTAGSQGAGKTAYAYSVDLSQAVSTGEEPCVTDLTVDFGPVSKLQYDGSGTSDDIFVITQGSVGKIGLYEAVQTGNAITFTFNQPVCAGTRAGAGAVSNFIGVASGSAPKSVAVAVGWPGLLPLKVEARAPAY